MRLEAAPAEAGRRPTGRAQPETAPTATREATRPKPPPRSGNETGDEPGAAAAGNADGESTGSASGDGEGSASADGSGAAASSNGSAKAKKQRRAPANQDALELGSNYITNATVSYVPASGGDPVQVTDGTVIPDDVTAFEITVDFENVPTKDLHDTYGGKITYTLPTPFTNPSVTGGDIFDNQVPPNRVGTITAENGKIVLSYNDTYFQEHPNDDSKTNGSFTFRCSVDQSSLTENPTTVTIGDTTISLTFQEREIAETGELRISKAAPTYIAGADAANEGYLEYTVTVSTGDDAMPQVRVEDSISSGSKYASGYLATGTLADGTPTSIESTDVLAGGSEVTLPGNNGTLSIAGSNPGKMTWTIGDMDPHQTRTLTYRVKLNQDYVGLYNTTALANTAVPYSKDYPHGSATSSFTPHAHATVTKEAGIATENEEKTTVTIPYTVTIQADADNTWPIRNLKIADNLGGSYGSGDHASSTNDANFKALNNNNAKYKNFQVYSVKDGTWTPLEIKTPHVNASGKSADNPDVHYGSDSAWNPRFDLYAGDAEPGASLVVTYDLVIDKKVFTALSGTWNIKNNASVRTDDQHSTQDGGNTQVGSGTSSTTIGTQIWDRKADGALTTEAVTQSPGDGKADATIPAGAIKYQVVANELGQWDISGATLADTLGSRLQYKGYLQVDYFATGLSQAASSTAAAVSALQGMDPTKTVYCDIDGKTSFSVTPDSIGLPDKGAYLLTYYVVPVGTDNMTRYSATNTFGVSGSVVGPGSTTAITMGPVSTQTSQFFQGGSNFAANKQGWYYDTASQDAYWVIECTGEKVPSGLSLKDVPVGGCGTPELVGVYVGAASGSGGTIAGAYRDLASFRAASGFQQVDASKYSWSDSTITFNEDITIPAGQKVHIVVKTPRVLNVDNIVKGGTYTLRNKVQLRDAGADANDWRDISEDTLSTNGGGNFFKDTAQVLTRDAQGNWATVGPDGTSATSANVATERATQAGIYIDWRIKVNQLAGLEGTYHVIDQLPEGVEPVYVRYFAAGSGATGDAAPTMPAVSGLDDGWSDIALSGDGHDAHAYYNAGTRQIRFDVGNLQWAANAGGRSTDAKSLEVQVLVKVTDDQATAGVLKTFENTAKATDDAGGSLSDSSTATVSVPAVDKATTGLSQGVVPFSITVNPRAESLANGAQTLTVVDELKDPLAFNVDSIKATDGGGNDITGSIAIRDGGRTEAGDGSIMYFDIPNETTVTITYTATPYVAPNGYFDIGNKAYLTGYNDGASESNETHVHNTVSATTSTKDPPIIQVTKRDRDQVSKVLQGAQFQLQKVTWNAESGTWEDAEDGPQTATSGEDGVAKFTGLEYNTAYRLTETAAPQGYAVEDAPRYIVVAQATNTDRNNPQYPAAVATYAKQGASVQYGGQTFYVNAYDRAVTSVAVSKAWDDGDDADGLRPDGVTVRLLADGQATDKTAVLNANNGWSCTFGNLPVKVDGKTVAYTVTEDEVENYTTEKSGDAASGYTFTNKHAPETTSVKVSKAWDDAGNQDGKRPERATVRLLADGEDTGQTATLDAGNDWTCTFEGLTKNKAGNAIDYTVEETDVPEGYSAKVTGDQSDGYTVTNTHEPETIDISGTKTWDDADDQDGVRPDDEGITVYLLANGQQVDEQTVKPDENGDWSFSFAGKPKFSGGTEITYTVVEKAVEGYSTTVEGYDIANARTPDQTSVTVTKAWNDDNDRDRVRPGSVTVKLLADGEDTGKTVELSADNNWSSQFTKLPVNKAGRPIAYTVEESGTVEGYGEPVVTGNATQGYVVTNTHEVATTSVAVSKEWDDGDDADGSRPESVTVRLLADGVDTGKSAVLSADGNWAAAFAGLPANSAGNPIAYSVSEDAVEGYTASVSGSAAEGYTVTNSHTPTAANGGGSKAAGKSGKAAGSGGSTSAFAKTGDPMGTLAVGCVLLAAEIAGITCIVANRKRKRAK